MSGSSTCKSCGRPIVWAISRAGKNIPMDPEPTPKGTHSMVASTENGRIRYDLRSKASTDQEDAKFHVSHFVTCPNAAQHRKGK